MPDFTTTFVVDCDVSGVGFDAVLHQGAGPLAYFSRPFVARHLKLVVYERELIGLVQAISKFFGFDFSVEYRPGHLNTVADALSHRDAEEGATATMEGETVAVHALSEPTFTLLDDIRRATTTAPDGQQLL
ncbi:uncharacterized protein [Miscanthus floridulus]|uniref:uncharacterized protein n=1 Tax=Miscanthus floridulus TaxID=154761 RepID=UPI0034577A1E